MVLSPALHRETVRMWPAPYLLSMAIANGGLLGSRQLKKQERQVQAGDSLCTLEPLSAT